MVDRNTSFSGERVRVGVVGLRRGAMFARILAAHPDARLAALCDRNPGLLEQVGDTFEDLNPARCASFEELLDADIDAVVLANDATGHAPLAVAALEAGKHVLSEVPACSTMAEAVQLVEAAENNSALYMMAENYCCHPTTAEMRRRFAAGDLGEFQHGEGEYVHDAEMIWPQLTRGRADHWRNRRTSTFYCTHSVGPLLHVTGTRVTRVVAMETPNRVGYRYGRLHGDSAVLICQTSNNGTIKSLQSHGGLRREPPSTWLALYGTQGSMETDRWKRGTVWTYLTRPQGADAVATQLTPKLVNVHDLSGYERLAEQFSTAHGGSDLITTHEFLQAVLGRCPVQIDAFRATDMSLPGLLGFRSIFEGNVPYDVPNLRDPASRDRWRNDHWAAQPTTTGQEEPESPCSFPVPHVPDNVYQSQRAQAEAAGYPAVERM